jgi:two-component system KDP operon response regulator KdpE
LLQRVWGPEYGEESDYLWAYVRRLRRKIEADPDHPRYLLTEPGVGYRFSGRDSA